MCICFRERTVFIDGMVGVGVHWKFLFFSKANRSLIIERYI